MTTYKCGHKSKPIFVKNTNANVYALHKVWMDTKGFHGDNSQCFPCFLKEHGKL